MISNKISIDLRNLTLKQKKNIADILKQQLTSEQKKNPTINMKPYGACATLIKNYIQEIIP